MKLTITQIQGGRDCEEIELEVYKLHSAARYSLLENSVIKIGIVCDPVWTSASLLIGEYEFLCRRIEGDEAESQFIWEPAYRKNGYGLQSMFHNYFGLVSISIELSNEITSQLVPFEPIEIFAKKLTAERTNKMLNFLLNEKNEQILSLISPTSIGAKISNNGITPGELLSYLEVTVQNAELLISKITRNPIKRLKNVASYHYVNESTHLDEQSLVWIIENVGTCQPSDSIEEAQFSYDDIWYKVPEIMIYSPVESTDIYENRIIHVFLKKLKINLDVFLKNLNESSKAASNRAVPAGYVSFFQLIDTTTGRTRQLYRTRISILEDRLRRLTNIIEKKIPVSNEQIRGFTVTERIKKNRSYLEIMRIIKNWFEVKLVQWNKLNLLVNINNTPKLFELYCILSLNAQLHTKIADSLNNSLFNGTIGNFEVELLYDYPFYKPRHRLASEQYLTNSDLERRKDALNDSETKAWTHVYHNRRPDISLVLRSNSVIKSVWIFDAKYKDPESAYSEDLPSCAMKYFHGLHDYEGRSVVKGVFIVHPVQDRSNDRVYLDYHAAPYGIFGGYPALPALGTVGLEIDSLGEERDLSRLVDRCLSLSSLV
ncbi:MAG: DUF2357 domain-containing protein [Pseudomonadota bacterium]